MNSDRVKVSNGRTRKKENGIRIPIWLPNHLAKKVYQLSKAYGLSVSGTIRYIIMKYLEEKGLLKDEVIAK
ncbi:MAG: hypothetical protein J7J99_06285 [Thermoprotei archaeon]|nr:hypothetical protein [Thermoprotei archaeon]